MKTEDQLVAEFRQACVDVIACTHAVKQAEDALSDVKRTQDEAYRALENFRAEKDEDAV